jgi:hypothetical protein
MKKLAVTIGFLLLGFHSAAETCMDKWNAIIAANRDLYNLGSAIADATMANDEEALNDLWPQYYYLDAWIVAANLGYEAQCGGHQAM